MCKKYIKKGKNIQNCKSSRWFSFDISKVSSYLLLFLIVLSGVYYLSLINSRVTAGYKIDELEKKVALMKENNNKLELKFIKLNQISRVEDRAGELQMVLVDSVEYLNSDDEGLAMR